MEELNLENTKSKSQLWIGVGCLLAAISVGFGAIGAHMLEKWLLENFEDAARRQEIWETASRYLMYHALGLIAVGLVNFSGRFKRNLVGIVMLIGVILFCGCLYGYVLTNVKVLVHIVPLGGLSLIVSWLMFAAFTISFKNEGGA